MGKHRKFEPGTIVEHLEVLENLGIRENGPSRRRMTYFKCRCTRCGNIIDVPIKNLGTAQKDCGCWRKSPRSDIKIGDQFGRLTVIGEPIPTANKGYKYLCECSCPNKKKILVLGGHLKSGEVKSCGCIHDELLRENVKKYYKRNFVKKTSVSKLMSDSLQKNNTSGVRGVTWHKGAHKWMVSVSYQKQRYHLGYYESLEVAKKVVDTARDNIRKDFESWYRKEFPDEWERIRKKRGEKGAEI